MCAMLGAALWAAPSLAEPPRLAWPVDCTLGETCFIEDHLDADRGPGLRDHACGIKTRDGHRGTDIMLLSPAAMEAGIDVRAAAPGRVAGLRDGIPDRPVSDASRAEIEGRECGNGVRLDHGDGWATLYCHMRRGTIAVRPGEGVRAGTVLGHVGLSGLTNAPHLHFGVFKDGSVIDPFRPDPDPTCRTPAGDGLWQSAPPYDAAGLFTAGFATAIPTLETVRNGAARVTSATPSAALVLYGHVFHAQPDDRLILAASGPEGEIFRHELTLEAPERQLFRAYGRHAPTGGWAAGDYRGQVTLARGNRILALRHADITIAP